MKVSFHLHDHEHAKWYLWRSGDDFDLSHAHLLVCWPHIMWLWLRTNGIPVWKATGHANRLHAIFFFLFFFFVFVFLLFRATPIAHGSSQATSSMELQLLAYTIATPVQDLSHVFDLNYRSQQHWILNPLSKARDWTHILMDTSRTHFRWATTGTPTYLHILFPLSLLRMHFQQEGGNKEEKMLLPTQQNV